MRHVKATLALAMLATLQAAPAAFAQDGPPPPRDERPAPPPPRDAPPPRHDWHAGDRYDGPRNRVDWRHEKLPPPPDRHHRWVRDREGNFVLIAISTGIIANVLMHDR